MCHRYSDILLFMVKLAAAHIHCGMSDTIQLFPWFGKAINISNVSMVVRAACFKLPVIVFRRLECHVLMGYILNYPSVKLTLCVGVFYMRSYFAFSCIRTVQ